MAKTHAPVAEHEEDYFTSLIADSIPAPKVSGKIVRNAAVPASITAHVGQLSQTGEGTLLNLAGDEDKFAEIRQHYINAAYAIEHSANVRKYPNAENWTHTRVSVGSKRGKPSRNSGNDQAGATVEHHEGAEQDVQDGAAAISRGW